MPLWEFLDWGVRSFVLLTLALVIARVVERRWASLAHHLLVASMGMVLLLPLATWLLPGWGAAMWPASSPPVAVETTLAPVQAPATAVSPAIDGPGMMPFVQEEHSPETFLPSDFATTDEPAPIETVPPQDILSDVITVGGTAVPVVAEVSPSLLTVPLVLVVVWSAVAAMLLVRVALGLWRLRRVTSECQIASDPLAGQVRELARELGLRHEIDVALAAADTMPMAFWYRRWRIVLPGNFASWPEPVRTTTLVHELGHVARRDAWSDLLVQSVAAALWPVPLVWLVSREIRRLRERACDEWTLVRSGLGVQEYAHALLEVVGRCQRRPVRFAYAMAGRQEFESRLAWIVTRSRGVMPRRWVSRATLLGVFSLGMAIASAMTGAQESASVPGAEVPSGEVGMEEVIVSAEPSPDEPAISVRGTVVDKEGRPIHSADVVLRQTHSSGQYAWGIPHSRDILARTKTNAQGEFQFEQVGIPPRMVETLTALREGKPAVQVVAWSEGKALKWLEVASFDPQDQRLVLQEPAKVVGRVTDEAGKPIAAGRVRVLGLTRKTGEIDGFLREPGDLNLIRSELDFTAAIDGGRITLAHMPKDYRITLWCEGATGERAFVLVDTAQKGMDRPVTHRMRSFETQRSPLDITAKQHGWVRIKVLDHEGNPVTGGGLEAVDSERHHGGDAAVDSDGTALLIVNEPGVHTVYYASDPLTPTLGHVETLDIRAEEMPEVVFRLVEPHWVTGKVVDSETREPIPGVYIQAGQVENDKSATRSMGSMGVSGRDGKFKVAIAEGEWKLSIRQDVDGYFAPSITNGYSVEKKPVLSERTVFSDAIPEEVTIPIAHGLRLSGRVLDPDGNPLAGATVRAMNLDSPYREVSTVTDGEGKFLLVGCSPYVKTRVLVWSDAGAAYELISASPDHPWEETRHKTLELQLQPGSSVSGRVMRNKKPASDVTVRLHKGFPVEDRPDATQFVTIAETKTDSDGNYVLSGLRRGDRYQLQIEPLGNAEVRDWHHQSPYFNTMEAKAGETVELPDAVLVSQGQELAGTVVDTDGKPVAGITVSARLVSGSFLTRTERGPAPWMETDAEGRFHLTHLPDEPISLMAYRRNPAGGRIMYPSVVTPEQNATDIRIVIDPRLGKGLENLDE